MNNQRLIRSAHIWVLTGLIALGLWAIAGKAGIRDQSQNSNQNQNGNSNTGNSNQSQNNNANRNQNRNNNTSATGEQAGMSNLSSQDQKFVMDAAMASLVEVEAGRMATQQGASDQVKQFGQRMVDEHTAANTELMSLASSKGITLPTAIDDKHRNDMTKLSGMSGAEFDRAFSKMMLKDHDKAVDMFEKQSTKGTDADLKAFASKMLPALQEHREMARALPGNQRGNSNSNSNNSNRGSGNANGNNNGNSNRP
jgi:putative membrane protein